MRPTGARIVPISRQLAGFWTRQDTQNLLWGLHDFARGAPSSEAEDTTPAPCTGPCTGSPRSPSPLSSRRNTSCPETSSTPVS